MSRAKLRTRDGWKALDRIGLFGAAALGVALVLIWPRASITNPIPRWLNAGVEPSSSTQTTEGNGQSAAGPIGSSGAAAEAMSAPSEQQTTTTLADASTALENAASDAKAAATSTSGKLVDGLAGRAEKAKATTNEITSAIADRTAQAGESVRNGIKAANDTAKSAMAAASEATEVGRADSVSLPANGSTAGEAEARSGGTSTREDKGASQSEPSSAASSQAPHEAQTAKPDGAGNTDQAQITESAQAASTSATRAPRITAPSLALAKPDLSASTPAGTMANAAPAPRDRGNETASSAPKTASTAPVRINCDDLGIGIEVAFGSGAAGLTERQNRQLQAIADCAKRNGLVLEVAGHTDSEGDSVANLLLSVTRAESVAATLRSMGMALDKLRPRGYGESQPRADNFTPKGRAANRRVTIRQIAG